MQHDYNLSDLKFVQMMIKHHQAAVDAAAKAYHDAKSPEVREWARAIWAGQSAEIEKFNVWLAARGEKASGGHGGM